MFQNLGISEIAVIAVVLLVLFGGKKLPELARGLTKASEEFQKGLKGESEDNASKK